MERQRNGPFYRYIVTKCMQAQQASLNSSKNHSVNIRIMRYLNLKATDVQITALFLRWSPTGSIIFNSQTAKQIKDFRFKCEITFERLKYSQRNATYNSVG